MSLSINDSPRLDLNATTLSISAPDRIGPRREATDAIVARRIASYGLETRRRSAVVAV